MVFLQSEHCTPEFLQAWEDSLACSFADIRDGFPFGPAPHLTGDLQPAGTMCVVNKDFHRNCVDYSKGMKGQFLAEIKDEDGKMWARIVVEGVTTEKHIRSGYTWVERHDIDKVMVAA